MAIKNKILDKILISIAIIVGAIYAYVVVIYQLLGGWKC